jgi:hypothetical protein
MANENYEKKMEGRRSLFKATEFLTDRDHRRPLRHFTDKCDNVSCGCTQVILEVAKAVKSKGTQVTTGKVAISSCGHIYHMRPARRVLLQQPPLVA